MSSSRLRYLLHSGKNARIVYFARSYMRRIVPCAIYRSRLYREMGRISDVADSDYIRQRVDYYNKLATLDNGDDFFRESIAIERLPMTRQKVYWFDTMEYARWFQPNARKPSKVYWFDTMEYARWFPPYLRLMLLEGDITAVPDVPCLLKSRPVVGDNANSVLLNMDKVRHFVFINDKTSFEQKKDIAIFRGKIDRKPNRIMFMEKFWGNARFDLGAIDNVNAEWIKPKISIYDHLKNRYVMALEGNDVAGNLKWIMSSNSIAVMPRPRFETWFMEGTLIPDYHYIEVKDDFSDVEEKLDYYSSHIDEALAIIKHAHDYVAQFRDKRRERLISLLVLDKYFSITNSYKNIMNYERHEL